MKCACATLYRLDDAEARHYATEHLQRLAVDNETWSVTYECPGTGRKWLLDYPHSEYHGGGPPRLRQLDFDGTPLEVVLKDPDL
ncbi:hypothetical protein ARHIZOSPH14_25230 [Agromyces rhizosphaerae]|uniref:Uncharacterized protein n=1 Tax=Agromyces rhizosphaerae TaxID=88374 RepID=A0A9W6CYD1_9MICO|nr:Imm27 family immunity protein [Agromyces rhizosphaerae]GLI28281.1 hypothetical protein ARHIZOSPH14_25230 [Agromyces rhizosphaerae]